MRPTELRFLLQPLLWKPILQHQHQPLPFSKQPGDLIILLKLPHFSSQRAQLLLYLPIVSVQLLQLILRISCLCLLFSAVPQPIAQTLLQSHLFPPIPFKRLSQLIQPSFKPQQLLSLVFQLLSLLFLPPLPPPVLLTPQQQLNAPRLLFFAIRALVPPPFCGLPPPISFIDWRQARITYWLYQQISPFFSQAPF